MNNKSKIDSKNIFEKHSFKQTNNSLFGKSIRNNRKQ